MTSLLLESDFKGMAVGSPEWFIAQKGVIKSRPLVRFCYDRWYRRFLEEEATVSSSMKGIILEIGSGGSYLNEIRKDVVTSDIVPGVADHVINARSLPFPDLSVRAIFMSHSFHHIPEVERFFCEVSRVLVPGGILFMVEVAHTPFARVFFSRCCRDEGYNDRTQSWDFDQSDTMADANQALSWVIFSRDYLTFCEKYPQLRLRKKEYLPWLGYLLSGGVTRRNLVPGSMSPVIQWIESSLSFLQPLVALHWALTVRKVSK
jgi:SAM-dependent methyltransferase